MKDRSIADRVSKTRISKFKSDPTFKEKVAFYTRKAWADGKYDSVPVGKCKWYDHVKPDGSTIKLQGTWEVAFAIRLDELGLDYVAHRGRFSYRDGVVERSYYPDFWVPAWGLYVDVKGAFWDDQQSEKIDKIKASNPTLQLLVATKQILESMKVDLVTVQKRLLEM